ncbi:uncharacterized protein N7484_009612 [Penicillium longicatenatum]|uniref:uncharacterized protein n=1 Tax=Penicillium longicatenatum TaxID=1561947 RepID=UPI00254937D2|nr:uncharacterized protein N7484_009612 [Penicillium longicatenatum]KAJ5636299.1 hypothetical protein N7484_009612 [Penicillium longicatenatum]
MTKEKVVTGSCLCRKVTGSICMANSFYLKPQIRILSGEDSLKVYDDGQTASGNVLNRSFCSNCGSCLFTTRMVDGVTQDGVVLSSGTFDLSEGEEQWVPQKEFYCKDRAAWLPPLDNTVQFSTM